jgi:hypothetical protein
MQTFTAFPLRARATLEIFDASIKLYKQYFWVLLGWSAIMTGVSMIASVLPVGSMATLFITPLSIGSVVCCIAAAVRGQSVSFGQCWNFTQSRYWWMLGMHILASIVGFLLLFIVFAAAAAIIVGGVFAFRESSVGLQIAMGVLAFLVLGSIATILTTIFMSWIGLVPIIICMEEGTRGMASLRRSYDILSGHWLRITTLMALVGLAMLALFLMLGGLVSLAVGIGRITDLIQGRGEDAVIWIAIAAMGFLYVVLWTIWTPLYYLILSVFYLDVRVRQEALDLEWTAHTSAPVAAPPETGVAGMPVDSVPAYSPTGLRSSSVLPPNPSQETISPDPAVAPAQPYNSPLPGNTPNSVPEQPTGS